MTVDIPDVLYRRLRKQAVRDGQTVRSLMLRAIELVLKPDSTTLPKRVNLPLVSSKRPGKLRIDNTRIVDVISFP